MESAGTQWSTLEAYDPLTAGATRAIEACAQADRSGRLVFRFVLRGDISRIRIPATGSSGRGDDLWKHTCFEAFVREEGAVPYHEFNFAPSLDWAIYRFDDYRAGMSAAQVDSAPEIAVRRMTDRLELDASVKLHSLIQGRAAQRLHIGLSAIVEGQDGSLSYWALKHAAGRPDFHSPDAFALPLTM